MAKMKFGKIRLDPAKNPAVLDTATWDLRSACDIVLCLDDSYWQSIQEAIGQGCPLPLDRNCMPYAGSCAPYQGNMFFLAGLADGQHIFIEVGAGKNGSVLGEPIVSRALADGKRLSVYRTDATTIDRYVRFIRPDKGPKAMGATPRLGIGSRMSTAVWPGVWRAMDECGFCANAIQNSVRELNLLDDVLAGHPPRANYLFNFGTIEEGHTGSTFEGLWVAGVLEALKTDTHPAYGADADHIMVKRGPEGISRAERVIDAARYYDFFTLDVSDILDYEAMAVGSESVAREYMTDNIRQPGQQKAVLAHHSQKRRIAGQSCELDEATIGRLVGKYWSALNAAEKLCEHIKTLKNEILFDLELSIDEVPPHIKVFESLTSDMELIFLVSEAQRRQIPLTHVAPNFGIEKGVDYRCPDTLAGLEKRVRRLHHIASEFGIMLDCHSGDDLTSATRKVIGRATKGQNHFKVSPALQVIFAEVLNDVEPEQFRFWWDDTLDYARCEAAAGSDFAAACIRQYEAGSNPAPSPGHAVFHHYNFASIGRRDAGGQFIHRERFYDLSPDFYRQYRDRVALYLCDVAADVFDRT